MAVLVFHAREQLVRIGHSQMPRSGMIASSWRKVRPRMAVLDFTDASGSHTIETFSLRRSWTIASFAKSQARDGRSDVPSARVDRVHPIIPSAAIMDDRKLSRKVRPGMAVLMFQARGWIACIR
jgi:hypothetical protein